MLTPRTSRSYPGSRFSAAVAICVLAVSVSTCKLGELVNPSQPGVLSLNPLLLSDSAPVGSTTPRTLTASVTVSASSDSIPWTAHVALSSAWLHILPPTGTAPGSATVSLDPTGLAVGTYLDTLLFNIAGGAGAPIAVPVQFRIVGCVITTVTPTIIVQDSLTGKDCSAPGRIGKFGRLFGFSGNSGDSISLRLFSTAFDTYLVLDTVLGGVPLAQNDNCAAGSTDACLNYILLPRTGTYVIEATSATAGATGLLRLDILRPRPPVTPDTLRQLLADLVTPVAVGGPVDVGSINLRGTVTDPDLDSARLDVEVRPLGTAFSNNATGQSVRVASGALATVLVTGLSDDISYHWQARAVDKTGRASAWLAFGGNAETAADFRIAVPQPPAGPSALIQLKSDGVTVIAVGGTNDAATTLFQSPVSDPDPGDQLRLEIEVQPLGSAFTNAATGSSPPVANGGSATATIAGLADNAAYHWQARTVDQTGRASAWTSFGGNAESAADFRIAITPAKLTFTVQPSTTTAGAAIAPAVQVAAQDAAGNTLASFTGTVTMTLGANPGSGALSGTTSVAAVAGVATFSSLAINRTGSGYTLIAGGASLLVTSTAFTVAPGAATQLAWQVQPPNGTAGAALAPALQVAALDALGNVATGFSGTVQLAFGANPGGATLGGTTAVTAASGVATFSTVSVNRIGSGYTLAASATGLTAATSSAFDIAAGGAGMLVVVQQPSPAATSGAALAVQPAVQLQDAIGNSVAQLGLVVTASVAGAPAGLVLTGASATTDATGKASFATLTLTGPVGSYPLTFSATGVSAALSNAVVLSAGPAAKLAMQTQPSASATTAVAFTQQPSVQVQDASLNPVAQSGTVVTAAIATGGGTLGGTLTATTSSAGLATFTNLAITGSSGARTLSFSANGLTAATSTSVTLGAGAATQIAAQAGDGQSAVAGSAVTTPPAVLVRDGSGNPIAGVAVTFAVTGGGGSIQPTSAVTTLANGIAALTSWTLGTTAGANTLTATVTGLTGSPVTFTATGTAGAAAHLNKTSGDNLTGPVGTTLGTAQEVTVTDANNNPVSGVSVTWAAATGGGSVNPTTSNTSGTGKATTTRTLGATPGAQTTTATVSIGGTPTTVTFTTTASVGGASQMTLSAGDNQTDTVAATLATPLAVLVTDGLGNPVSGVTITWNVIAGGGSVTPGSSLTNAQGIATTSWTLGTTAGPGTARASGVAAAINFISTATSGAVNAGQTSVSVAPATITASGGSSTSTVTVTARDAFGNPVSGKSVTLSATGTGNTIVQPAAPTSVGGATTGTFASTLAGAHTVTAVVGGVTATQQPTVTIDPATATGVAFIVQPSTATAGAAIVPAVQVEIRDAFGNRAVSATNAVTVALGANPGSGTLGGTLTTNAVAGVAMFSGLTVDRAATGYTLAASSGSLAGATSGTFNITVGAASTTTSTVSLSAGTVASGSAVSVTLRARDASGNNLPSGGLTNVAFTRSGGSSTGSFGAVNDNGDGSYSANFTGVLAGTATTIGATIGGSAVASTQSLTVTPGPVSLATSQVTVAPPGVTSGDTSTITLQAKDAAGNNLTTGGLSVAFALAPSPAGGTSTGSISGVTDNGTGSYSATFTGIAVGTPRTITATIGGSPVTSTLPTIVVSPGNASTVTSVVTVAGNATTVVSGSTLVVTLQAKDANGNNLTAGGEGVSFTLTGGTSTATFTAAADNGNGTYTATLTGVVAGTASRVHAAVNGNPVTTAAPSVTVTPGAVSAAQSTVSALPVSIPADGTTSTITVTAKDAAGNTIPGASVTFAATGTNNSGLAATTTNSSGVATATISSTAAGVKTVSATISGTLVTQTANVTVTAVAQTITFNQPTSPATYGSSFGIAPTSSSGLAVTVTPSGGCSLAGGTVTMTSGTTNCVLTASQAGNASFAAAANVVRTVIAAPLAASVTPNAASKAFGAADPTLTGTLAGFLAGDNVTATYARIAGEAVGGYTISATLNAAGGSGVLTNYAITSNTATFTIGQASQTITFNQPTSPAVYGSSFAVTPSTTSGLAVTVTPSGGCSIAGSTVTMTSGTVDCVLTASQAGDASYTAATNVVRTVVASRLAASVTPNAASKAFGAADPAFTGTLTGFLAGDNVTATYARNAGESVGSYTISASLSAAGGPGVLANYTITSNTATFTINQASQSISFTQPTSPATYGSSFGIAPTATSGLTVTVTPSGGCSLAGSTVTMTSGTVNCVLTASQAGDASYTAATNVARTVAAAQRAASVTPNAASKAFGAADPAFTGSLSGFLAGDNVTATYSRNAGESVGSYTISASLSAAGGPGVLANYAITSNTATFTINQASQSITLNQPTSPADYGSSFGITATATSGLTVTVTPSGGCSIAGTTVTMTSGTVDCVLTASQAGDASYAAATNVARTVAAALKAASVTPNAASKAFGDVDPTFTGTLTGFLAGDNVTATYSRNAGESVGSYTISASLSAAGGPSVLANYAITSNTAGFTITQAAQSITFTQPTTPAAYGTSFAVAPLASSGLAVTVTPSGGCSIAGGTVTMTSGTVDCVLTASQAGDASYSAATDVVHTVVAATKAASVTADAASKQSGDTDPTFTGTLTGFLAGDNVTATYARNAGEAVGTYTITPTPQAAGGAGVLANYSITINTAIFTINPGAATHLDITTQPSNTTAGSGLTLVVTALDAGNNVATAFTGAVSLVVTSGPGALFGYAPVTAAGGVATFTGTGLNIHAAGTYQLTASASGLTDATTNSFVIAEAAPNHLTYTTSPGNTTAGTRFTVALELRDAFDNVVTNFDDNVVLSLRNGTGTAGAHLGGTLTRPTVSGVVSFPGLSIDSAGTGYLLDADFAHGVPIATAAAFDVAVGPASIATSIVSVSPTVVSLTGTPTATVTLVALDSMGNRLTTGGLTVLFSITPSVGESDGTFSGVTDNLDGTYTATFTGVLPGTPTVIDATINGVTVTHTPKPTIQVDP